MNTEKQSLQNAADQIGLTIHERPTQDRRKTVKMYYAVIDNLSVSPVLDYDKMNHFLLGWINCVKNTQL
jgi:hypothetical protein